ncbi:MAG: sodium-dependent transporter, partial [Oscillibacter sp.]|nr:sodium-dependent transporter [Oscillibacter sp.]
MKRENFGSRLGFLLVSAGCAIGLGNVWKFPYITGLYGGGVFVLVYLLFLAIMGVPVLTMELAVGRASRKSVVEAYKTLEPAGTKWHLHGWVALAGNYILMMFYTTVSAWMTGFFLKYLTGVFNGLEGTEIDSVYANMQSSPAEMVVTMSAVVCLGFLVCSIGLQEGVERISKVMMLGLLALILVLAVNSCLLPGAAEGLKFYLLPDFARAAEAGFG